MIFHIFQMITFPTTTDIIIRSISMVLILSTTSNGSATTVIQTSLKDARFVGQMGLYIKQNKI